MKVRLLLALCLLPCCLLADTLGKYAGIAKSIPQARLKADPQSQAWARSARSILDVTEETIAQTIQSMQALALQQQQAIFCLPQGQSLDTAKVHQVLEQLIANINETEAKQTISEAVIAKLAADYSCSKTKFKQSANSSPQTGLFNQEPYQMAHVDR